MTAPSTTSGGVYQGYPYRNPLVIDVPSVDPLTAATWANLPRNPIVPGQSSSRNNPATRIQNDNRDNMNIETNSNSNQRDTSNPKQDPDEYPVVYIDFPTNELGEYVGGESTREVNRTPGNNSENDESNFVEDTIYYDPFEDRRIDVIQSNSSTGSASADTPMSDVSTPQLQQPGSSGLGGSSSPSSHQEPFRSKETQVYSPRPRADDSFLQSTIPASRFPEPPPAYTEIDTTSELPSPPRTEVVIPVTENNSRGRKLISCCYCGQRVYTLAIKQNGALTHVLAIMFIFLFAPIVIVIYCTDLFKYRNHYCPNCNKLVAYEVPMVCQGMTYTKTL